MLAPLGTFQQILQPERCFQLKVPDIAEFHSKRMNMFSTMAVIQSSRFALRLLRLPMVTPESSVWSRGADGKGIVLDDASVDDTPEPDPHENITVEIKGDDGKIVQVIKGPEYFQTHSEEEARTLARAGKIVLRHGPPSQQPRRAILLERFMLTLFSDSPDKYDPHILKYRQNEYNPFVLDEMTAAPKGIYFNELSARWLTTGEFTIVAYRLFLEIALFDHCDAVSVNAERFTNLFFCKNIMDELNKYNPEIRQATGVANALDTHLYMDKWYV
ncbi:hypothetical protein EC988_008986, partial [Linderina pennispora]